MCTLYLLICLMLCNAEKKSSYNFPNPKDYRVADLLRNVDSKKKNRFDSKDSEKMFELKWKKMNIFPHTVP